MTNVSGPSAPPPGWYRESSTSADYRWWDGREWTEHRTAAAPWGVIDQPPLPSGTSVGTVWIWLLSLVPLLALAAEQPLLSAYGPFLREQVRVQREMLAHPGTLDASGAEAVGALFLLSWCLDLLLIGVAALWAYLDWRALKRRGLVRPFPWGWGFLTGVYIVGRVVVVRRRTGRGLAPMWVAVGFLVLAMFVQFAEFASAVGAAGVLTPR